MSENILKEIDKEVEEIIRGPSDQLIHIEECEYYDPIWNDIWLIGNALNDSNKIESSNNN